MSIRLRLTLLYSVILALTLVAFGAVLYLTQSRITYDSVRENLARQAQEIAVRERRAQPRRQEGTAPGSPLPLPGRWSQTRNADGTVIARSMDLGDTTLPISPDSLRAALSGTAVTEEVFVQDEPLLIYNEPVTIQGAVTGIVQVAASLSEREQYLSTLRLILGIGTGFTILAAFAVGWWLAGTAIRPIHRITHTAQAIGAERNFARRVDHVGPNDEVGQLAVTFNGMLTELESAYHQVEGALQTQRRFVADASHELRTPLTTIRGNIELLRHDPPIEGKERADVLTDTKDEVERLIRLVNQLLVLARGDSGRPIRLSAVPLGPVLNDACRQAKLLAPKREITIDTGLDLAVQANRDALKQLLLILLDNALVHTTPSSSIHVTTEQQDHRAVIRVRDTGPGIAPDLLPHLFERFYRGNASRSGGGAGLGLSIAQDLVRAQDGTLSVESQVGQGSVFTVTLPLASGS